MEKEGKKYKKSAYIIGVVSGVLAIVCCLVSLGLSVANHYTAIYMLSLALIFLGVNRIGLHLNNFKKNMIENISMTAFVFVLALLLAFTKYNIYFLITSFFLYCLTVIIARLLKIKEDHSTQSIVFNLLCVVFVFLSSFVFFFPAIYTKHATSVSNSNFIAMCFAVTIIFSSGKNLIFPYHKALKVNVISNIFRKSLVYEILLGLAILVILCSIYFTMVEPSMTSYVDSLWYSFCLITTIGLGDLSVSTTLGRILSVLLGVSGIVVVALFTSVIVNFYNEMNKKREEKEMNKLVNEVEQIEKIEEEKNKTK